jgi:hypothetical protein
MTSAVGSDAKNRCKAIASDRARMKSAATKTEAAALGLTIPDAVLARAKTVIE